MGPVHGYLGRFHHQISAIAEGGERPMFGWMMPGFSKFSVLNVFASAFLGKKEFYFDTSANGSKRANIPICSFEEVCPLDILPVHLLRALAVEDLERSEELGCLELDEEDVALFSYVCPGKQDYGPMLRNVLTRIEKEG